MIITEKWSDASMGLLIALAVYCKDDEMSMYRALLLEKLNDCDEIEDQNESEGIYDDYNNNINCINLFKLQKLKIQQEVLSRNGTSKGRKAPISKRTIFFKKRI
ncbi:unnamed protein product [Brachionus calyciflorus]|uniref:Uncharacterized protein n=1 Tax=Brachionus calyciflorus TaxID=104777 RepID=A0A814FG43_9BILA|nr:unnamed protein product [Brachionus calyciflorus]